MFYQTKGCSLSMKKAELARKPEFREHGFFHKSACVHCSGRVVANLPYPNWNYFLIGGRAGRHPEALSRIS
jgi:hypothetical protein